MYLDNLVLFGQIGSIWAKGGCVWAKGGCIRAKVVCVWAKWFYLGKLVVTGETGSILAKVVVFEQKVVVLAQNGSIWAN